MGDLIHHLLARHRVIHMVGLSTNPARDAFSVAAYMRQHGYRVVPVHPKAEAVAGEPAFESLSAAELGEPVRFVDVFVNTSRVPALTEELLTLPNLEAVWFQLGVVDEPSIARLREAGIEVVADRCVKVEHRQRFAP